MIFIFWAILHRDCHAPCNAKSLFRPGCSWVPSRLSPGTASVPLRLHYHPYRNRRSLGEGDSQSYAAAKALAQIPEAFADGRNLMLTLELQHRRMAKTLAKYIRNRRSFSEGDSQYTPFSIHPTVIKKHEFASEERAWQSP